jgi:hypothetical protein
MILSILYIQLTTPSSFSINIIYSLESFVKHYFCVNYYLLSMTYRLKH